MSGRLPACFAAASLATISVDATEVLTFTWMSGFAWFQTSTIFSMFGAHDQYSRVIGPSGVVAASSVPGAEQPVRRRAPTVRVASERARMRAAGFIIEVVPWVWPAALRAIVPSK